MYAPPPSPQIENLSQAQTAVMPFMHHVASPSSRGRAALALKLGLVALAVGAVVIFVAAATSRT